MQERQPPMLLGVPNHHYLVLFPLHGTCYHLINYKIYISICFYSSTHRLSALLSNWSQKRPVTWHHFDGHHPGPGHHCFLPRLLKWLLDHSFLLPSSFQAYSQNTQSDSLQMYVISLLKTLFCFPLHLG